MYHELYHHNDPHWLAVGMHYNPYLLLALVPLIGIEYFFYYYELESEALYCRRLWQRLSIPYSEIENITAKAGRIGNFVNICYSGGKKLKIVVETPFTFFDALVSHAPQAESRPAF